MSLAIIIFNIFYNPNLPAQVTDHPFICTLVSISIEHAVWFFFDYVVQMKRQHKGKDEEDDEGEDVEKLLEGEQKNDLSDLKIVNKYQMMSMRFTPVFFLFVCQLTLAMFYMYSINCRTATEGWSNSSGLRWFIGILLCNITDKDQAGAVFDLPFWQKLISNKKEMTCKGRMGCFRVSYWVQAILRMLMSIGVNLFTRGIVVFTAPIL